MENANTNMNIWTGIREYKYEYEDWSHTGIDSEINLM